MFIPTNAYVSSLKFVLKLLRHVSVFLHRLQGAYKLCQLKLRIVTMIKYNTSVGPYGKMWLHM